MMSKTNRRAGDMLAAERAYRQGLRRRASDRADLWAYYGMLALMLAIFTTLGVMSWLAR